MDNTKGLDARATGKIKALGNRLQWQLPETDNLKDLRELQEFILDPKIKKELDLFTAENTSIEVKTAGRKLGYASRGRPARRLDSLEND